MSFYTHYTKQARKILASSDEKKKIFIFCITKSGEIRIFRVFFLRKRLVLPPCFIYRLLFLIFFEIPYIFIEKCNYFGILPRKMMFVYLTSLKSST